MNYQKIYDNIIVQAKLECRKKKNGIYYESHHILPKCLGGNNLKQNKILLTAREHYICHKLLTYIYKGNRKIVCAFHLMTFMNKKKYILTSREYAYARELMQLTPMSEETKQKYKKPQTEETKEKIRNSLKGIKFTQDRIENIKKGTINAMNRLDVKEHIKNNRLDVHGNKNPFFNKKHTKESKEKMRKSHIGKKQTIESNNKRSISLKNYWLKIKNKNDASQF